MQIIRFSAMWCPACLIMNNRINKLVNKYDIELIDYDYDIDEEKVNEYQVGTILPVFIIEKDGVEVKRLVGELSDKKLEAEISDIL